ncbi:hypothetical protein F511_06616 [Dorcoceras hygrometricum]|uniref:Uncharacterized protein n=1 Tax=Dorcoceras hygrometricum TaxID=472368 RepID=A0A2Z7AV47_9LAMI|nr:hypothetical protein F511_06616 [Dorcoceras hygrometricum]
MYSLYFEPDRWSVFMVECKEFLQLLAVGSGVYKQLYKSNLLVEILPIEEKGEIACADSDSEESSSVTSSSSESEDEVHCLMADDTEEVFDFSNLEFTREDLVTALNDMVQEYNKLSKSFEEVKAERESYATKAELVSSSNIQAALSKLATENEELKSRSQEMLNENQWLAGIISSWTRSSASLDKLHGAMKPTGEKYGLGYDGNDSSTTEISSTPQLARTNFEQ